MATLREDNHRLNETVTDLRAERRAQDRKIRDLEHQLSLLEVKAVAPETMPQLPVEVVAPAAAPAARDGASEGRVVGIADDGSEIVYEGDAALGKAAVVDATAGRSGGASGEDEPIARRTGGASAPLPMSNVPAASDRLEVTRHIPPLLARASRARARTDRDPPPTAGDAAATEYRGAVELLKARKHADAIAALRAFIQHFPKHDYADNAQYWLGEAFYAQKDYSHALVEFRATIESYPRGNKVPDALLKVGYCYQALGQAEKAHAVLEQVVTLYPHTEPAALASKRLETP
jgi:tol-pal system protein YbgF